MATLNERGVRYAIIGGIAMMQHVRPRATDDVDAIILVPQIAMPGLFEALVARGFTLDVLECIRQLRDEGMTCVHFGPVAVDLLRPVIPAYARVLDRAARREIRGQLVPIASVEGLIVTKLLAMRPRDEADIQDLLATHREGLDLAYIRSELATFTRPDDPRRAKFEAWAKAGTR